MKKILNIAIFLMLGISPLWAQIHLDSILIAHYPLNGNANDISGNNFHASNQSVSFTSDRFGNANSAGLFNGSAYLTVPNGARFKSNTSSSLSFWIKTTMKTRFDLFDQRTGNFNPDYYNYGLIFNFDTTAHSIDFNYPGYSNNILYSNSTSFRNNNWNHMVFIKDTLSSTMLIYFNCSLIASQPLNDTNFAINGSLYIGRPYTSGYFFVGSLDDIRIYDRAINSAEVCALFNETGIEEINANESSIIFYPNPAGNYLTIESKQKASIEILNIEGQIIKRINANDKAITIDISSLASGMYFIKAKMESGLVVKKFIKQ